MAGQGSKLRRISRNMTRKVCVVCGKEFWSVGDGDVCPKPSTCRVKKHQLKLKTDQLAQTLMMDFDYFAAYQRVIAQRPTLTAALQEFIVAHGIPAAKGNLAMLERMLAGEI